VPTLISFEAPTWVPPEEQSGAARLGPQAKNATEPVTGPSPPESVAVSTTESPSSISAVLTWVVIVGAVAAGWALSPGGVSSVGVSLLGSSSSGSSRVKHSVVEFVCEPAVYADDSSGAYSARKQ
jgi:hypothetical protein